MQIRFKTTSIYFRASGSGSAVVLLHGFLETSDMWEFIWSDMAQNHQVISIDLPGHGQSGCLGEVHTMEIMAEAVIAVLNHLEVGAAKFVGHSMGGYVALALAEQQPERVSSLCLMNSTFEADDNARKDLRQRANRMVKTDFENVVRLTFANLFATESKVTYKKAYENALDLALQTSTQGYIAAMEGMRLRPDRLNVFKNVPGKKLIILGLKDAVINHEEIEAKIVASSIELEKFSEGHMSHIENISEITYTLKRFIE